MNPLKLYYHPFSRAADVVWMLEELELPYELCFVDITQGDQKKPEFLRLNPMGKLPVIQDGSAVVSEKTAIGMYLADKYSLGTLAPALDTPLRASYLRWCLFSPSVVEPAAMAHAAGWEYRAGSAGWGTWDSVMSSIEAALSTGPYVLGEAFSMADAVFGGTLRYMVRFRMMQPTPLITEYIQTLDQRPARKRADAVNDRESAKLGTS